MVLNDISVTFTPATVIKHSRKSKPFDNLYIDNMQTRNYALYHVLGNILPGKIGIKVWTQTSSLLCSRRPGWKLGNLGKLWNFFSEIFKSEFLVLAIGQNQKLGDKKTRNNISKIFEVSEFSICHFSFFKRLFFFQFSTVGNSVLSIYVVFCFQSLLKCFFLHEKYMFKILPCHNKIYLLWDVSSLMRTWGISISNLMKGFNLSHA